MSRSVPGLDSVARTAEVSAVNSIIRSLNSDARVTTLWLGPLHLEALLAQERRAEASKPLAKYAEIVAVCQSPHFSREVLRLQRAVA